MFQTFNGVDFVKSTFVYFICLFGVYVSINSVIMYHIYLLTNICPDVSLIIFLSVKFL